MQILFQKLGSIITQPCGPILKPRYLATCFAEKSIPECIKKKIKSIQYGQKDLYRNSYSLCKQNKVLR